MFEEFSCALQRRSSWHVLTILPDLLAEGAIPTERALNRLPSIHSSFDGLSKDSMVWHVERGHPPNFARPPSPAHLKAAPSRSCHRSGNGASTTVQDICGSSECSWSGSERTAVRGAHPVEEVDCAGSEAALHHMCDIGDVNAPCRCICAHQHPTLPACTHFTERRKARCYRCFLSKTPLHPL